VEHQVVVPGLRTPLTRGIRQHRLTGLVLHPEVAHRFAELERLLTQPDRLQRTQALAVEVDGTCMGTHEIVTFHPDRRDARMSQQRQGHDADRTAADDNNFVVPGHSHS
jgi:hypothetical protein